MKFIKPCSDNHNKEKKESAIQGLLKVVYERINARMPSDDWLSRPVNVFISDGYDSPTNRTMFICVNGSPNQMSLIVENEGSYGLIRITNSSRDSNPREILVKKEQIPGGFDFDLF